MWNPKKNNYTPGKRSAYLFFIIIGLFHSLAEASAFGSSLPSSQVVDVSDPQVSAGEVPSKNQVPPARIISKPTVLPDDDAKIRLLEITVGAYKFDDLINVYQYGDTLFVPFGTFSELIDLAIKADPSSGIAKGFVFDEKKTFYLDINRGEVTLSGIMTTFNNIRTAVRALDDIYVDSSLLSEWLPLNVEIDLYASRLKIITDAPLPFELRIERESRIKRTQTRLLPRDRGYPRYTAPYEPWSVPHINLTARAGMFNNSADEFGGTFSHVTYATADLFKMESAWYLAGDQDKLIDDYRVTFGRKDVDNELLGPLKAREYSIGHVVEPRMDLINQSNSVQPGLFVSSYPLTQQLQYDSHSFSGDLPPGLQVELYRNNALLGFRPTSIEGRYEFNDVPLLFGHNHFRLVFYGPQGQTREETQTFELGQSLTIPGEQYYRVMVTDDEDYSGSRTVMQYDVGLNKHFSANAGFVSLPLASGQLTSRSVTNHQYVTAGLRSFQKYVFFKTNYTSDSQSGSALDWGIQSRLGPVILNLSEVYFYDGYISEEFNRPVSPITRRTEFKLDTAIPTMNFVNVPIAFEYERESFEDGSWRTRAVNRISAQKHGYAVTNTLTWNSATRQQDVLSDILQVSRRMARYNLRANLGFRLKPESEMDSVAVTADGFKLWGFHANAGFNKVLLADTEQFTFGLNRDFRGYNLGLDSRLSTDGTFSLDLIFTMALAREPREANWIKDSRPIANQGTMSALVFLDENGDGKKSADEEALKGVKVNINGGGIRNKTDENGIVFLSLEPYREVDIDIDLATLEDPLWLPANEGVRIDLRPGHTMQLDFPVIQSGEIDGTTYVKFGDIEREISGIIIELLDEDGLVIQSTKTAYDGFFVLSKIPLGNYQLRISDNQIEKLGVQSVETIAITITNEEQIINGQNFVLIKAE